MITPIRAVTSTIGSWFEENEVAQVTRMMRALDPHFAKDAFERELREYIIPEVVDAYLSADKEALMKWCSEAVRSHPWCSSILLDLARVDRLTTCYGPRWSNISVEDW